MAIPPARRGRPSRVSWPAWALMALGLAAFLTWTSFNQALAGCHPDGVSGGGIDGLANPLRVFSPGGAVELAHGWSSYATSAGSTQSVTALILGTFVADLVLMSVLTTGLISAHRRLSVGQRAFTIVAGCYWLADATETTLASFGWADLDTNRARLIGLFSLLKWVALATSLTLLVVHRRLSRAPTPSA